MITLFNSSSKTFVANTGATASVNDLQLNILIELRVLTALLIAQGLGQVTDDISQLRSDVVNDSVNPVV